MIVLNLCFASSYVTMRSAKVGCLRGRACAAVCTPARECVCACVCVRVGVRVCAAVCTLVLINRPFA